MALRKVHTSVIFFLPPPSGRVLPLSRPQLPVQGTILNRLGNVVAGYFHCARQIRDGSRDLQNPVVGPRAQIQIRHRVLEQLLRRLVQFAELLQFARPHALI